MSFCYIFPILKKCLLIFHPCDRFPRVRPLHPLKICWFFTSEFSPECFENFMKNQQSLSKPTYHKQIRHYRTINYINIHYFFSRFSTELCSNDYVECERGLHIAKPKFAECSKIPPRRAVRWQVSTAHIAYAPTLSRRQGRGVLFSPVMPFLSFHVEFVHFI